MNLPPQPLNHVAELFNNLSQDWKHAPEGWHIDQLAANLAAQVANFSEAVPVAYLKKEGIHQFDDLSEFLSHYGVGLHFEDMGDISRLSLAIEHTNDFVWLNFSSLGESRFMKVAK